MSGKTDRDRASILDFAMFAYGFDEWIDQKEADDRVRTFIRWYLTNIFAGSFPSNRARAIASIKALRNVCDRIQLVAEALEVKYAKKQQRG